MPRRAPDVRPPFKVTPLVFHVLFSLADAPAHAYGVMKDIEQRTRGRVDVAPGSLHFTIRRLLDAGLIEHAPSPADDTDAEPRRRYFRLTPGGRALVRDELALLEDIVSLARSRRLAPKR